MNIKTSQEQKAKNKKRRISYAWLNILPDDLWLRVRPGQTIWKALQSTDVEIEGDCGGLGKCGKCKVKVLSEVPPPSRREKELLGADELKQGIRLACRTKIDHDVVISTGENGTAGEFFKILTTSHVGNTEYISQSQLAPLVEKKPVILPSGFRSDGLSDLDRIKAVLGVGYENLKAPLHCLRTLPRVLKRSRLRGAAVLHGDCLLAWQNRGDMQRHYGLVFDIGTSTLVGKLLDLVSGNEVAVASSLNSQIRHGSDVISRLQYVKDHSKGLEKLHNLLIRDLNQLVMHLLKGGRLEPDDIFIAVVAGNTTMQHLLLNLDPSGIAEAPFSPVLTDGLIVNAADVGLQLNPTALLYTMPAKSGYIGGDLISDVLSSGVAEQEEEIILGLDLGTNGEIFLGNGKRLLTCSAAAGPAMEGARISYGMIARAGAIEWVGYEGGHLVYQTIGNVNPRGICGSGLVDLIAVLVHHGVIDREGLICAPHKGLADDLNSRIVDQAGVYYFILVSAEDGYNHRPIYLTQQDVREFQLAKGAIAAGINTLMDEMGIGVQDIDRVYLAGALGNYVETSSAISTGLLPGIKRETVRSLGNAASLGAARVLVSRSYWQTAKEVAGFIEHIELSSRSDFNQYFIENMDFPEQGG